MLSEHLPHTLGKLRKMNAIMWISECSVSSMLFLKYSGIFKQKLWIRIKNYTYSKYMCDIIYNRRLLLKCITFMYKYNLLKKNNSKSVYTKLYAKSVEYKIIHILKINFSNS